MSNPFCTTVATVLGATGGVVFPTLAGYAQHQGFDDLGLGLWASAAVSVAIGILGYLEPAGTRGPQRANVPAAAAPYVTRLCDLP